MPTPAEDAVLAANRAFYAAFRERDAPAMEQLWALEHPASCIHPGWAPLVGRQNVLASWRAIFGAPDPPRVEMSEPHVVVVDSCAFVTCVEHLADATVAATNVFVQEGSAWRMIHHHGGPMPTPRASRRPVSSEMN